MTERGGLLVIIAGPNYIPAEYAARTSDLLPYAPQSSARRAIASATSPLGAPGWG